MGKVLYLMTFLHLHLVESPHHPNTFYAWAKFYVWMCLMTFMHLLLGESKPSTKFYTLRVKFYAGIRFDGWWPFCTYSLLRVSHHHKVLEMAQVMCDDFFALATRNAPMKCPTKLYACIKFCVWWPFCTYNYFCVWWPYCT